MKKLLVLCIMLGVIVPPSFAAKSKKSSSKKKSDQVQAPANPVKAQSTASVPKPTKTSFAAVFLKAIAPGALIVAAVGYVTFIFLNKRQDGNDFWSLGKKKSKKERKGANPGNKNTANPDNDDPDEETEPTPDITAKHNHPGGQSTQYKEGGILRPRSVVYPSATISTESTKEKKEKRKSRVNWGQPEILGEPRTAPSPTKSGKEKFVKLSPMLEPEEDTDDTSPVSPAQSVLVAEQPQPEVLGAAHIQPTEEVKKELIHEPNTSVGKQEVTQPTQAVEPNVSPVDPALVAALSVPRPVRQSVFASNRITKRHSQEFSLPVDSNANMEKKNTQRSSIEIQPARKQVPTAPIAKPAEPTQQNVIAQAADSLYVPSAPIEQVGPQQATNTTLSKTSQSKPRIPRSGSQEFVGQPRATELSKKEKRSSLDSNRDKKLEDSWIHVNISQQNKSKTSDTQVAPATSIDSKTTPESEQDEY